MMFLLLLIIGAVVYYHLEYKNGYEKAKKPLDQLQSRYINGEIDEETYLKMKRVLEK